MVRRLKQHKSKENHLKNNQSHMEGKKMYLALTLVLICVVAGAIGQIFLKKGIIAVGGFQLSEIFSMKIFTVFLNPAIFAGLVLYVISMVLWLVAMTSFDISFMYPLVSIGYVLTAFFAMTFLGEHVSVMRWMGIIMIVGGVFFIIRT